MSKSNVDEDSTNTWQLRMDAVHGYIMDGIEDRIQK